MKKWICGALVLALFIAIPPIFGFGFEQGYGELEVLEMREETLTIQDAVATVDGGPVLAEGNHTLWIDRIANLPEYAGEFYGWLQDNAHAQGTLADPTKGETVGTRYAHTVTTISGKATFTYPLSATNSEILALAKEAAVADLGTQPQIAMQYVTAVYGAFDMDYPEVFWLNGSTLTGYGMRYGYSGFGGVATATYEVPVYFYLSGSDFDIRATKYQSVTTISETIANRDSYISEILEDCPQTSDYDKLRYLNQTLTRRNCYNSAVAEGNKDAASTDAWQCISALKGNVGTEGPVCEGYSRAMKVLCDELGIPCVLVSGDSKSYASDTPGAHMWNYVQLDGGWYALDSTWNDPTVSGVTSAVSGYEHEKWFLRGGKSQVDTDFTFLDSHVPTNQATSKGLQYINGPVLSDDDYVMPENLLALNTYRGEPFTAPVRQGYVFGGWFADAELTKPLEDTVTEGYAYAKFVDAQVLSVKWQVTDNGSAGDLRLLTSVDTLSYDQVGFSVTMKGKTGEIKTTRVYERIRMDGWWLRDPASVFGEEANYFMCHTLTDVATADYDTQIQVTPYWVTLDGTRVEGEELSFSINEGL